jgi:hypothetical protein
VLPFELLFLALDELGRNSATREQVHSKLSRKTAKQSRFDSRVNIHSNCRLLFSRKTTKRRRFRLTSRGSPGLHKAS